MGSIPSSAMDLTSRTEMEPRSSSIHRELVGSGEGVTEGGWRADSPTEMT